MIPAARIQEAISCLDEIFISYFPADAVLGHRFKKKRYIGSKDRQFIAGEVYKVLRRLYTLRWRLAEAGAKADGRMLMFASMIGDGISIDVIDKHTQAGEYAPPALLKPEIVQLEKLQRWKGDMPEHARLGYPEWLEGELKETFGDSFEAEWLSLKQEAAVDLRANTLKTTRAELMNALITHAIEVSPTRYSPLGVRLPKRAPIFSLPEFREGWFEMQDEASQLASMLVDAAPGQKVIDFCAGAGGKTLAIAAQMQGKGRILAMDTSESRLGQMQPRLNRANVHNVQIKLLKGLNDPFLKRHKGTADRVLCDVPCSGLGTIRRNPDLLFKLTPERLREYQEMQQAILEAGSELVGPSGRLIYATCSLLRAENEAQIEKFLNKFKGFRVAGAKEIWNKLLPEEWPFSSTPVDQGYVRLTPHRHGTDGFFVCVLERA